MGEQAKNRGRKVKIGQEGLTTSTVTDLPRNELEQPQKTGEANSEAIDTGLRQLLDAWSTLSAEAKAELGAIARGIDCNGSSNFLDVMNSAPTSKRGATRKKSANEPAKKKLPKDPEKRYVYVDLPRCPECGSSQLRAYHTARDLDSIQRHTCCTACGARFIVILE